MCVFVLVHHLSDTFNNFFFSFSVSETAPLHPRGPGFSHSALLCGWPICGYHDCWGSGHHVCAEVWLVHGEDAPTGTAETTDSQREWPVFTKTNTPPCWPQWGSPSRVGRLSFTSLILAAFMTVFLLWKLDLQNALMWFSAVLTLVKLVSDLTAISCHHTVRLPRRERNVYNRKQSELLHQRGHHQESVWSRDHHPWHEVRVQFASSLTPSASLHTADCY